jgi:hypothetical protein
VVLTTTFGPFWLKIDCICSYIRLTRWQFAVLLLGTPRLPSPVPGRAALASGRLVFCLLCSVRPRFKTWHADRACVDFGCSAQTVTRIGLLQEIPRSGVQIPCLYLMGHYRCTRNLCYQRKLRYEANQVWMNTTFISQGPQSSGI